jgi:PAS domain S-box-containing protein
MPEAMHRKPGVTRILLFIGLLLSAVTSAAYLSYPPFIKSTSERTVDVLRSLAPTKAPSGSIVIVDIDEKSLARYGQWPWPRNRLAQLLRTINAAGAASIGLDLILAEPDRSSPRNSQTDAAPEPGHPAGKPDLETGLLDHDQDLADALAGGPIVLGYEFLFGENTKPQAECGLHAPIIVWVNLPDEVSNRPSFFAARGVICNRFLFSEAVTHSGFLNATPDGDGILRRVPMLIRFDDHLYPSLALATMMQYEKSDRIAIRLRKGSGSLDLKVGNRSIPVDTQGNMVVQFSRRDDAIPRISAGDVLSGNLATARLKGKIVVVGSSAAGLEPTYQTPTRRIHSHTDIHAQVLDNLLSGDQVIRTRMFLFWEVLAGLLIALCTGLAVARMRILPSAAACAALLAITWIGMRGIFEARGYLLSPFFATVLALLNYAVLTIVKTWKIQIVVREVAHSAITLLKTTEENMAAIIKAVPDIIFRLDSAGRIVFISPAIAKYTTHPDHLLGKSMLPLIKTEYRDAFLKLTEDVFRGVPGHLEFEAVGLNGRELWMDAHVLPFRDDAGEIVSLLGIARNVTDRKIAEQLLADKQHELEEINLHLEQRVADEVLESRKKDMILIQQSRQAAMGEMLGNIAHQWRQPLNTLGLIIQELRLTYGRDGFNKESLDASVKKAMAVIMHMSQTINDFSNYFRPDKEKSLFSVNGVVVKTLSLVEPSLKNLNIEVEVIKVTDAEINGYVQEYAQVLLNILLNCRDAFEEGNSDTPRVVTITIFKENDRSVLTVADNAGGIPEAVMGKIFDPYFTTKGPDKGTGIGLYMAKAIIEKNMGGRLSVRNSADGAEFRIEV